MIMREVGNINEIEFDIEFYLKVCEVRKEKGLFVDEECQKLAKDCIKYPEIHESCCLKLSNYIKNKNKR